MQSIPDTDLFGFSGERSGSNLPVPIEGRRWTFIEEIRGIRVEEYADPPQFHVALTAVMRDGYFMFHAEMVRHQQAGAEASRQLGID